MSKMWTCLSFLGARTPVPASLWSCLVRAPAPGRVNLLLRPHCTPTGTSCSQVQDRPVFSLYHSI